MMSYYYYHIQAHRPIQRTAITHSVRLTKAQGQRDGLHKKKALFPPQFSKAIHPYTKPQAALCMLKQWNSASKTLKGIEKN